MPRTRESAGMRPASVPRRESGCNDPFRGDISELRISDRILGAGACAVANAQAASHPQIQCKRGLERSVVIMAIPFELNGFNLTCRQAL